MEKQISVLIIETEAHLQNELTAIIENEGLSAVCCQNGKKALIAFDSCAFDIVVLELELPDTDSLTLMDSMLVSNPKTKFIYHTTSVSAEDVISAVNRGAFAFVLKSQGHISLLEQIRRAVQLKSIELDHTSVTSSQLPASQENRQPHSVGKESVGNRLSNNSGYEGLLSKYGQTSQGITFSYDNKFIELNRAARQMLGYRRGELLGRPETEIIAPESQDTIYHHMTSASNEPFEVLVLRKDKTTFPAEFHYKNYNFKGKRIKSTIIKDLTRQPSLNHPMIRYENCKELALQGADLGFWEWNVSTGALYIDQRICRMIECDSEEFVPHFSSWDKMIHPEDLDMVKSRWKNYFINKQPYFENEYRIVTGSGAIKWILSRGTMFKEDGSTLVTHVAGAVLDISNRKQIEEELRQAHANLEKRVERRTAELALSNKELKSAILEHRKIEKKLMVAKKEAEDANKAKDDFLANMSHELRTPMHHILNYSKFGIEKIEQVDNEQLKKFFTRINISGNKLLVLLNDLLDLSRLESGKLNLNIGKYDIISIINNVADNFVETSEGTDFSLEIIQPEFPTTIECDSIRIEQIIKKLFSNVIKYSPSKANVLVSFKESIIKTAEGPIPALITTVSDQGIGIPESELESIFDKFIQGSETDASAGGIGLGLSICKGIVKHHQGTIWAKNNPGGGAIFRFELPYCQ